MTFVEKMPAPNERFHASGGVPRRKVSEKQQVKWLVASVLNPRLREAATTLGASRGQSSGQGTRSETVRCRNLTQY